MDIKDFIMYYSYFVLIFFIVLSGAYAILLLCSVPDILRSFREDEEGNIQNLMQSTDLPPVTIVIPAYNEEGSVIDSVLSVLNNDYPNKNIIVVNGGSTDKTLEVLKSKFELQQVNSIIKRKVETVGELRGFYISKTYKNMIVIDKTVPDKSDNLNMALNACMTPVFMTLDADSVIEPDAISRIVYYIISNTHTVTAGGGVYISNGCTIKEGIVTKRKMSLKPICAFQTNEYLRSFLFSRSGFNLLGGALCYAGAFTIFEERAVVDIGGFDLGNAAQDFEIITHLQAYRFQKKYPLKVRFIPSATTWTEVPGTLKELFKQRAVWQMTTLRSLFLHWSMLFNPKYKTVGLFTYPFYLFGETLGPLVELSAYIVALIAYFTGNLNIYVTLLVVIIAWGFNMFLTIATALLNFITFNRYQKIGDLFWIVIYSFVENISYRQFLIAARFVGTIQYFTGKLNRHINELREMKKNRKTA